MSEEFPNKKGLLNIYFHVSENNGVGYFRQYLPAITLRKKGLANVMISDFRWGEGDHIEPDLPTLSKIANWADIIVVGRKDRGEFYAQWGGLKQLFNIPIVLDTDDNIQHVPPTNPGYMGYNPGSEAIEWNKQAMAKVFDAITVSTENLAKFYRKYTPKIFVLPNNLDISWWDSFPKKYHDDPVVRIVLIVSAAHTDSVRLIKDPIVRVLRKYPHVKFYITETFRKLFKNDKDVIARIDGVPWIPLKRGEREFPKEYKEIGADIGLAPVVDNLFNRGKSNLRWLEGSVQGIPMVVSSVEAYSCVQNGIDGLVVTEKEEWEEALCKLVEDQALREKIGENARQRIEKEYNIEQNIHLWLETYKGIHDTYHDFFGKKKQFIIGKKGLQELKGQRRT